MPAKDGDFREWRRFQALRLKSQGWCRREVAEALSVTERSVNRWLTIARNRGPEGLLSAPIPGRPPELLPQQLQRLPELLWHGAEAYGFRGDAWTCGRITQVIEQEFGVSYDKRHVSPIHRRAIVREFAEQTREKVRLEVLPGYAPDLNPWDEGGWHHLKSVEMRNLVCRDLEELHEQFHLAVHRLRQKAWLMQSFFNQAGLRL